MTNIACQSEIETQAKYWLWRIEQGLSQQERQAFVAWVNQDNKHHASLRKYSRSLTTAKLLAEFNGLFPIERKTSSKAKTFISQMSLAASVVFFGIITSEVFFNNSFSQLFQKTSMPVVYQQFSTKLGEQASFSLPDGSMVQLNTNSLLTISFSDSHRQLNLIKGEALFDVAKDKSRPFSVSSGQQSFTALGTIFNVQKNENNSLELIVTEGRVLIADSNESLPTLTRKIAYSTLQDNNNIIVAGEKAVIFNKIQLPRSEISPEALSHELAWQKGMLIFDGESLREALDEISRYTDLRFTIEDQQLANIKVAGYFKAGDVKSLLDSLTYNFDLNYKEIGNNTIVINKATIEGLSAASAL
ncbi:MAG: FecR domain-containing protein [Colwellia sp.]|nr:FecR domain-containing protein [Colwellia sp.]